MSAECRSQSPLPLPPRPRFRVELLDSGAREGDPVRNLARMLKRLSRRYGFIAARVERVEPEART